MVLPPCEVVIKAVSEYVASIKDLGNLDAVARDVFKQSQVSISPFLVSSFPSLPTPPLDCCEMSVARGTIDSARESVSEIWKMARMFLDKDLDIKSAKWCVS